LERLETTADERERAAALRGVGELHAPAAIPRLVTFVDPGKWTEAAAALRAIATSSQERRQTNLA
jgi:HEAT repeat protein